MAESMKASTRMTKNTVKECSFGQMADFMMAHGLMESKMGMEDIFHLNKKRSMENGRTERDLDGLKKKKCQNNETL